MNARIPLDPFALGQPALWDPETERNALGLAMLARPMPPWLAPEHFYPTQHQRIYEAVQTVGGHVVRVNVWLRESASKWGPPIAGAVDLVEMCLEAEHAERMGWAVDFERLRELAKQRALLETLQRLAIRLRHGDVSHAEARRALSEHFQEAK